jgi:putative protease
MAALDFARQHSISMIGDFSLNVTNPLSAQWFMQHGMQRVTASYDLNRDQLLELVEAMPGEWLEVVIHQHMPMFHMEHCVFCSVISPGTNKTNCGRPCDRHDVRLKDRIGVEHILHADIGCRNTLYNGVAQSGAEAVKPLIERGVKHFRVELLKDLESSEVAKLVELYQGLIAGKHSGSQVWQSLKAQNRLGVTRGTLEHPRNPLAIL